MGPSSRVADAPAPSGAGATAAPPVAAPAPGIRRAREAPMTARLADGGALPAAEVARAEACLASLGVATLGGAGHAPRGARAGATGDAAGFATLTVVGAWSLAEAQALMASGDCGAVRGVGLLEYCTEHAERRDLLAGTDTPPCILNRTLRDEVVCFSGIEGSEKAALAFKVEVRACPSRVRRALATCSGRWCVWRAGPGCRGQPELCSCAPGPGNEHVRGGGGPAGRPARGQAQGAAFFFKLRFPAARDPSSARGRLGTDTARAHAPGSRRDSECLL